jgi:hypothetical protein
MMSRIMCVTLLVLTLVMGRASADVDLTKVDRSIGKEPAYQSKTPGYCLLVFGPDASCRVWVVQDGDRLYVDATGTGDLTGEGKRLAVGKPAPGKELTIGTVPISGKRVAPKTTLKLSVVNNRKRVAIGVDCSSEGLPVEVTGISFGDSPKTAPIIHFQGPLSLFPNHPHTVKRGKEEELMVFVGTRGLGESVTRILHERVPEDVHPVAEIEFPAKEAGGKPIRRKVVLNQRC